jgi:uncharacterized membrane protein YccC
MLSGLDRDTLGHAVRTAVAATVSLVIARAFRLPEAHWAAISTLVVTQSTLGAALTISGQRFAGTALGALAAVFLAAYRGPNILAFAAGIFSLGIICAVLGLDRAAYRFSGITLAIVLLVSRSNSAWVIAAHRFFEVSLGIATGLAMTALWPERNPPRIAQGTSGFAPR